jgi:GTP cyclohydrolase I
VPPYDASRVEAAVRELLLAVGEDPDREGLVDTPARVARMYAEVFAGLHRNPDDLVLPLFDEKHDEMVIVKDIPLSSFCEHHLIPWTGHAAVGYLPGKDGRITGLSKLARLVDLYAQRPSVQERVTAQVADALMARLEPRGAIVSSRPSTCACRCAASRSPAPARSPPRCVGRSRAQRSPGPRR